MKQFIRQHAFDGDKNYDLILHQGFVKTLYEKPMHSVLGGVALSVAAVCAFANTLDTTYLWFLLTILLIYSLRLMDGLSYVKNGMDGSSSHENFSVIWERRYLLGATTICVWMGAFAIYSFAFHTYNAAAFIACGVSFGTMVSAVGRNYGSPIIIRTVVLVGVLPLLLGFVFVGWRDHNFWLSLTGVALVPFMLVAIRVSDDVRDMVRRNIVTGLKANDMGLLLNLALDNQPTGMLMVDKNGRIVVFNATARSLLGLPGAGYDQVLLGMPFDNFIETLRDHFSWSSDVTAGIKRELTKLRTARSNKLNVEVTPNRYLEFNASPIFDKEDKTQFRGSVIVFSDISHRKVTEEKMAMLANMDELTGLPNRRHWNELVNASAETTPRTQKIAIALLDIDKFKVINETLGQGNGDAVIIEIARKLSQSINHLKGHTTIVGRYGGDEFAIAICGVKNTDDIEIIFDQIFNNINQGIVVKGQNIHVRVTGGIQIHRNGAFDLNDCLSKASYALKKTRMTATRSWIEFSRAMNGDYERTLRIKAPLRDELPPEALEMKYQPMYSTDGSFFDCCEALVRWNHPEIGAIAPSEFIKVAEEMGAIHAVTKDIVTKACAECASWPGRTSVSVNISAINLAHPDFLQMITECLETSGLPPQRLTVEITETVMVNDFADVSRILASLRALGVKIALDDFGTGYSSLSYLAKLQIDKVKIDRAFVTNLTSDDKANDLLKGILDLSRTLDFEIVVEGVETREQLQLVLNAGRVDRIQGYLFSKPVSSDVIAQASAQFESDHKTASGNLLKLEDFRA